MLDQSKPIEAEIPEALAEAIDTIDRSFDEPGQLLQADIRPFEELELSVFAYFTREDIFYLNKAGRKLLTLKQPSFSNSKQSSPPIFWLEDQATFLSIDRYVTQSCQPAFLTRELVTLAWGKTWLEGAKFPIRSLAGKPLAILFAGTEMNGVHQIRQIANQYQISHTALENN